MTGFHAARRRRLLSAEEADTVEELLDELGVSRRRRAVRVLLRQVALHERLADLVLPDVGGQVEERRR